MLHNLNINTSVNSDQENLKELYDGLDFEEVILAHQIQKLNENLQEQLKIVQSLTARFLS